jgi:hypothetical protein
LRCLSPPVSALRPWLSRCLTPATFTGSFPGESVGPVPTRAPYFPPYCVLFGMVRRDPWLAANALAAPSPARMNGDERQRTNGAPLPRWGSRVRIPSSAPGQRPFLRPGITGRVTIRVTVGARVLSLHIQQAVHPGRCIPLELAHHVLVSREDPGVGVPSPALQRWPGRRPPRATWPPRVQVVERHPTEAGSSGEVGPGARKRGRLPRLAEPLLQYRSFVTGAVRGLLGDGPPVLSGNGLGGVGQPPVRPLWKVPGLRYAGIDL